MKKNLIIVPCFNEEDSINECIDSLFDVTKNIEDQDFTILVINDGSSDNTKSLLDEYDNKIKVLSSAINFGLSEVFNTAMEYAKNNNFEYSVFFDADNQYPANEIPKLIEEAFMKNSDILIGTRDFSKTNHFSTTKNFLQKAGSKAVSFVLGQNISDVTSGFRVYSKRATNILFSTNTFTYTIETLFQAKSDKLKINHIDIDKVSLTRDSRLFQSNSEYIRKSLVIILKSLLLYKSKVTGLVYLGVFSIPGFLILSRFFMPYFSKGYNTGNIQSLVFGTGYFIIFILIFVSTYLLLDNFKKHSQVKKYLYSPKHT